jgi:hypothetical protein
MESTDQAVLDSVEHDVLRVEILETSLWKALQALRPGTEILDGRGRELGEELAQLDAEVGRLAAAIAAGGELPALVAALQERERRRAYLRADVAALERTIGRSEHDDLPGSAPNSGAPHRSAGRVAKEPPEARRAVRALLNGRLIFTPQGEGAGRYSAFEGPGTASPIIAG